MLDAVLIAIQMLVPAVVIYMVWRDHRNDRRGRNVARMQHDIACEGGAWPHPGACMPKGPAGSQQELVYWVMLGQSSALGFGRLPVAMLAQMQIPSRIKSQEEDRGCNGFD